MENLITQAQNIVLTADANLFLYIPAIGLALAVKSFWEAIR